MPSAPSVRDSSWIQLMEDSDINVTTEGQHFSNYCLEAVDENSYSFENSNLSHIERLNNGSSNDPWRVYFYRNAIPVMLFFCIVSIVTNLVIVFSVHWVRRHLSPTHSLSIGLSIADAYASLVIGMGLVTNSLLPTVYKIELGEYSMCFVLTLEVFRMSGMIASAFHLLALAINHYIGIIRPLHYPSLVTRRYILLTIALMWIVPFAFFFIYFSSVKDMAFQSRYCEKNDFIVKRKFRLVVSMWLFIPLLMMAAIYSHIFVIVRQHHRSQSNKHQNKKHLNKNIKAITTTLLILGTYILGWVPALIMFLLICVDCAYPFDILPKELIIQLAFVCNTLIIIKSLVDPIIYAARMKEIRDALRRMRFSCCSCFGQPHRRDDFSSMRSRNDTAGTSLKMHSIYHRRDQSTYNGHRNPSSMSHLNHSSIRSNETVVLVKENGC